MKKRSFYDARVKGGVVPSDTNVRFQAYKVPGKGLSGLVLDATRDVVGGMSRLVKSGSIERPNIVLGDGTIRIRQRSKTGRYRP
jgi:hypothetical protein